MADHPAWTVILQHTSICNVPCVAKLLCLCKELRDLVSARCAGQVPICFRAISQEQKQQAAAWFSLHSSLVAAHMELHLCCPESPAIIPDGPNSNTPDDEDSQQQQQQEQARQQLARAAAACHCTAAILQHLPSHLTSLHLTCENYAELATNGAVLRALAGLTACQDLKLSSSLTVCAGPLFEALTPLSSLSSLSVSRIINAGKLRHLPHQLQRLDLGTCSPGLQLGHLTALTQLSSTGRCLPVQPNDVLPPHLQLLAVGECHSVQRLVELKQLQQLSMAASHIPARRLQRLSRSLTQLTGVHLSYQAGFNEAAAAWGELPLQRLELEPGALSNDVITSATVQELTRLSGLTYLHIQRVDRLEATREQLAAVLAQLTALQGLKLWSSGPWPLMHHAAAAAAPAAAAAAEAGLRASSGAGVPAAVGSVTAAAADASAAGNVTVMQAVSSLPSLTSLSLSLQNLGQPAAAQLAAATQLTSLKLRACGLDGATLSTLACSLTGLKCLFTEYNRDISDEVLPLFQSELMQLTELDVRYTTVSEAGKQYLRTLERLKQLQV